VPATPAGFELVGGRRDSFAGQPLAAIVYRRSPDILTLYVARKGSTTDLKALTPSSWGERNWLFGIAGNWQDPDVAAFRAATRTLTNEVEAVTR
jgi:anti-sigma factor RsiW